MPKKDCFESDDECEHTCNNDSRKNRKCYPKPQKCHIQTKPMSCRDGKDGKNGLDGKDGKDGERERMVETDVMAAMERMVKME